ncbi:hypothetical protein BV25DRAFT_1291779 [Artomyces pyxidatus]|uniref:Uncharacterized protein n=1 Tax=Artomyces pyxidatus TaxID=48021 RepID=A0ACB8SQA6_9AGAM|nr:hypothetical protein BV25DRAFT_1291779 [Artomyces pyxidatus]
MTAVATAGNSASSLTDALAAHHPDELFPLLTKVTITKPGDNLDVLLEALRIALRAHGERSRESIHDPEKGDCMKVWVVRRQRSDIVAENVTQSL